MPDHVKLKFTYTELGARPFPASNRLVKIFRPLIPITLINKNRFCHMAVLLDSGADFNLIHGDVASYLGLNLTLGSKRTISGISGQIRGYKHKLQLKIDNYLYKTTVIFSNQLPNNAIAVLGNQGFFDKFAVKFNYPKLITITHFNYGKR